MSKFRALFSTATRNYSTAALPAKPAVQKRFKPKVFTPVPDIEPLPKAPVSSDTAIDDSAVQWIKPLYMRGWTIKAQIHHGNAVSTLKRTYKFKQPAETKSFMHNVLHRAVEHQHGIQTTFTRNSLLVSLSSPTLPTHEHVNSALHAEDLYESMRPAGLRKKPWSTRHPESVSTLLERLEETNKLSITTRLPEEWKVLKQTEAATKDTMVAVKTMRKLFRLPSNEKTAAFGDAVCALVPAEEFGSKEEMVRPYRFTVDVDLPAREVLVGLGGGTEITEADRELAKRVDGCLEL